MMAALSIWDPPPRRIAVFRALNLGDLLCSMPAFRALRRAFPAAHITLVGLESARPVVARYSKYIDDLELFPGDPAFPEQPARPAALPAFYRRMRSRAYDLVLQMHGSGAQSNAIVQSMATKRWAGFVPDAQSQAPGQLMAWPDDQHEVQRYLSLLTWLGLQASDSAMEFPLEPADHEAADRIATDCGVDPDMTIFVHPGARLPSRRWPVERFAAVANALGSEGWRIAITGSPDESGLVRSLLSALTVPATNLCAATTLGALASLLSRGRLLICNDTGISHIAAAVQLPSVVIASGSDVARWAPQDTQRHVVLHHPVACRPCGYWECPVGHVCARAITVDQVVEGARHKLNWSAR